MYASWKKQSVWYLENTIIMELSLECFSSCGIWWETRNILRLALCVYITSWFVLTALWRICALIMPILAYDTVFICYCFAGILSIAQVIQQCLETYHFIIWWNRLWLMLINLVISMATFQHMVSCFNVLQCVCVCCRVYVCVHMCMDRFLRYTYLYSGN